MSNLLNLSYVITSGIASHKDFQNLVESMLKERGWTDEELNTPYPFEGVENIAERFKESAISIIEEWGGKVTYWPGGLPKE